MLMFGKYWIKGNRVSRLRQNFLIQIRLINLIDLQKELREQEEGGRQIKRILKEKIYIYEFSVNIKKEKDREEKMFNL